MKSHTSHILMGLCLAASSGPLSGRAATIWTGPLITFTQAAPYPAPPGDRDQLTPNVALTRATPSGSGTGGMFNAVTETSFSKGSRPADTEWAIGSLANYATLSYTDWTTCGGGNPVHNLPGQQLVVHLISDNIYLSLLFTFLPSGPGFSYNRSTPASGDLPPTVAITSPTNGASFTAPANVPITANANDSDGSVTNVSFFDGGTLLGKTNNTPYTVTASLTTGSHALTAVATDNLGLSTTSAVVNVTVSSANVPPSVTITNPADNSVFGNTDSVRIGASVTNGVGTVTNVQFFNGAVLLRSFSTGPYAFNATGIAGNLALGTNTLTAVATDNLGASATSGPVHVIIARYLPPITNGNLALFMIPDR